VEPCFVLLHSPLVGPSTWAPVAGELTGQGFPVRVPSLVRVTEGAPPAWPRVAAAVTAALADLPPDQPVALVAHSNAGLFVPVVRAAVSQPVSASIFVDARLPDRPGATPVAEEEFLASRRDLVQPDGLLPRWTEWWGDADLTPLFPDEATRARVTAEQPRLPLSYFEQRVPVPDGWDDHRCAYLLFSEAYADVAQRARKNGWVVRHLPGEHLHQLVDPASTGRELVSLARGER
jgi:hypothetical protein